MWDPVVASMKKKLAGWKGRFLSFGGRITLINSILSSLLLYFFSFYKAPRRVLKALTGIQRKFLWGGCADLNKVNWVSWEKVCLPKHKGGLGVKNLELFNISLLSKWRWRCLVDKTAVWYKLLHFKYDLSGVFFSE